MKLVVQRIASGVLVGALALLSACASIGPATIARDRFDYSTRIAESWKQQALLNIVKLRYLDLPIFLDVGQIVSGYTVESTGSLGGSVASGDVLSSESGSVGGTVRYTDRPTITYTPLTGDRFLRGMLAPIRPGSVFALLQSGYSADFVLALSLDSINGVGNPTSSQANNQPAERSQAFIRVLTLLREIQLAGALNFRIDTGPQGEETLVFFRASDMPADIVAKIDEIRSLLGLTGTAGRYKLVYSPIPGGEGELSVHTRSVLQILMALAATVDVPAADLEAKRATQSPRMGDEAMPLFVKSGKEAPKDAYAAVPYRDHWFWIEDTDLRSKRAFAFIMFVFTLSDAGGNERLPVLTIPTG